MFTIQDDGSIAVWRCPDLRGVLSRLLGGYRLLRRFREFPDFAAEIPVGMEERVRNHEFKRHLVMVHAALPDGDECGARQTLRKLENGGSNGNHLPEPLKAQVRRVHSPFLYKQAMGLLSRLVDLDTDGEILLVVVDHNAQRLYPIAVRSRTTDGEVRCIGSCVWRDAEKSSFANGVPEIEPRFLSAWMIQLLFLNRLASEEAAQQALALGYATGQSFKTIVVNATGLPPDAFRKVRGHLEYEGGKLVGDAYFSVFFGDGDEAAKAAMGTLLYAYLHMPKDVRVLLLGTRKQISLMKRYHTEFGLDVLFAEKQTEIVDVVVRE